MSKKKRELKARIEELEARHTAERDLAMALGYQHGLLVFAALLDARLTLGPSPTDMPIPMVYGKLEHVHEARASAQMRIDAALEAYTTQARS